MHRAQALAAHCELHARGALVGEHRALGQVLARMVALRLQRVVRDGLLPRVVLAAGRGAAGGGGARAVSAAHRSNQGALRRPRSATGPMHARAAWQRTHSPKPDVAGLVRDVHLLPILLAGAVHLGLPPRGAPAPRSKRHRQRQVGRAQRVRHAGTSLSSTPAPWRGSAAMHAVLRGCPAVLLTCPHARGPRQCPRP